TMNKGYGTFDIADLTAGAYTVQVIFSGDDIYGAKSETRTFAVSKYDLPLEVEVSVPDRGNPTFSIDLGNDVTGSITVRINNNSYTEALVNGRATVTVTGLEAGSYSATVTYSGDNKYNSNSTACDFIIKAEPIISIAVDDINVGQTAYVNVSADSRITSVTVVLNGEYSLDLNNGEGSLPVSGLGYGNYTVYVVFNGNSELLNKTVNRTFSVSKVDVSQDSISMDNDFKAPEFAITLNDDATGDLTVTINANNYSQTISGGKATVVVGDLAPNDYEATVRYSGDSKYNPISKVFNFVIKAEPIINIEVKDILVGDVAAINITTDDGIDTVKVILNGEHDVEIINGKGNVSVHDLSAGKYTVKVIFEGNDNFFAKEVTANITVSKHQLPEDVFVQEGNNFTVNLPADATGTFTVEIGENISSSPVNGGTANVIVDDLNPGDYDILMSYSGDEKYANVSKVTTLNVPKWQSAIEANVSNIKVGEDAVFDIEVNEGATGNVSVIIDGKRYNGTLSNDKVKIIVPNLSNGTYEASVNYYGDNNYLPSNISKTFTVSKVDIEGSWYSIGQSIVINLPSDATGNVTVTVNNKDIVEDVIGGTAIITPELTPGTYPVSIAYSGDGKYNGIADISQIIVPKYDTPISASANEIIVGETLIVTITVPNAATGNVSVIIKGNSYNGTVNAGKAIVKVDNLPIGNYTAEINYVGDNNYSANKTSLEFEIDEQIAPNPDNAFVIPDTGTANPTFSINLENATGNFTVYVDGKEYKTVALVEGKATINVTDLPSGSHNITVAYSGDGRFAPISKNVTVNVPEPHVPVVELVGSDVTMLYTSGSVYKVRLTSDGVGLSGKTVLFTVNGKKISAVTDKNGYASVKIDLPPKSAKYTLTATYNDVKTSNTVKVNGIVTAKNVKVKKSKKVNKIKVTLKKVNGKYLKSKKLTLKINGKKVTAKTNKKGVATFKVKKNVLKKLKAGKKYKYTVTYLKETVTKKITVKK
ncbi:Ig-like domain repeat protein, partial [Methanobrevibacter sp.]|uniref:Ig-like domain repeat protein n=1 Tax=Methanobrevibacter sp. TaxID=66852 RepID=UPI0038647EC0